MSFSNSHGLQPLNLLKVVLDRIKNTEAATLLVNLALVPLVKVFDFLELLGAHVFNFLLNTLNKEVHILENRICDHLVLEVILHHHGS